MNIFSRFSVDSGFKYILTTAAIIVPLICGGIVLALVSNSVEAFTKFGFFHFLFSTNWCQTPGHESYGALPFIVGTLLTTGLALVMCIPFSLSIALFNGEYYKNKPLARVLGTIVDLLGPVVMTLGLSPQGSGILTASLVLTIMIIPYAASLSTEFIKMVSVKLKEGAYSLGATRAEVLSRIVFPTAGSGVFSAFILAIGRALGETMTVTMLIGNTNQLPGSLSDTGNSMASIVANQFGEADGLKLSSLFAIALLLFTITAIINMIGKIIIRRSAIKK